MYFLKLALRSWKLDFGYQCFSSLAMGFLLILIGLLGWSYQGLKPALVYLKKNQTLMMDLKEGLDEFQKKRVFEQVQAMASSRPPSKGWDRLERKEPRDKASFKLHWIGREQFLNYLARTDPDLQGALEGALSEGYLTVPSVLVLEGLLPDGMVSELQKLPGIDSVRLLKSHAWEGQQSLTRTLDKLRKGLFCLVLGLMGCLGVGWMHWIRLHSESYQEIWQLCRLWGAPDSFLVGSSVVSGGFSGLLSGFVAFLCWLAVQNLGWGQIQLTFRYWKGLPEPSLGWGLGLLGGSACLGLLAGWMGAQRSVLKN